MFVPMSEYLHWSFVTVVECAVTGAVVVDICVMQVVLTCAIGRTSQTEMPGQLLGFPPPSPPLPPSPLLLPPLLHAATRNAPTARGIRTVGFIRPVIAD